MNEQLSISTIYVPSVIQRLNEKKQRAKAELENIQKALDALEKNPDLIVVIDALGGSIY